MNTNNANFNFTSDYKRNEREEMLIAPPLDYSFKKATNVNGMCIQNNIISFLII